MQQPRFPRIAELFVGRYQIEQIIGSGGFSQVYRATQTDLGRQVAIKVLKPVNDPAKSQAEQAQKFESVSRRFQREAKLISRLKDRNTVMMYDYGTTADGLLYMVLEYVDGITISELLHQDGALEASRVVKIMRQALTSLHEAHSFGVLHRDIKPGNIMVYDHVGQTDLVKVLDFGIAKTVDSEEGTNLTKSGDVTADGVLVGTPRYMSPEQIRGKELTPSSDIYSVGLVSFEMLMGTKAVDADSSLRIIARHLDTEPINLPPDMKVPSRLRTIINKMLLKDPQDRYSSCTEVLEDLERWDEVIEPPGPQDNTITADSVVQQLPDLEPKKKSNNRIVVAGILLLGVAIVAMVALPSMMRSPEEDVATQGEPTNVEPTTTEEIAAIDNKGSDEAPVGEVPDEEDGTEAKDGEVDEAVEAAIARAAATEETAAEEAVADAKPDEADEKPEPTEEVEAAPKPPPKRTRRVRRPSRTKDKPKTESSDKVDSEKSIFKPFAVE